MKRVGRGTADLAINRHRGLPAAGAGGAGGPSNSFIFPSFPPLGETSRLLFNRRNVKKFPDEGKNVLRNVISYRV